MPVILDVNTLASHTYFGERALLPGDEQALAHRGVVADVLADKLVHRKIQHVVADGEVSARHVHLQTGRVVHDHDLGAEEKE